MEKIYVRSLDVVDPGKPTWAAVTFGIKATTHSIMLTFVGAKFRELIETNICGHV